MTSRDSRKPNAVGHKNPLTATITALVDMVSKKGRLDPVGEHERLEGKTALVTGANAGLGKAVAIDLANRGARVLMACRSGHPEAGEDVKRASGSDLVEMFKVDLSDLESVTALCDELKDRGEVIDIAIFNAGLMPARARKGPQGYELMFTVHFLANRLMVHRFVQDRVIQPSAQAGKRPRLVFVSSEAHRSSDAIDFDRFGEFVDYGLRDGLAEYGRTKLHLCTFASELARRLNPVSELVVSVHSLCPGPIASNIAREAPGWSKPILGPIMRFFFSSPEKAAAPVILLAAGEIMEGRNAVYLHMMREKPVSELASREVNGRMLWEKSRDLLSMLPDSNGIS